MTRRTLGESTIEVGRIEPRESTIEVIGVPAPPTPEPLRQTWARIRAALHRVEVRPPPTDPGEVPPIL